MSRSLLLALMIFVLVAPVPARGTSLEFIERDLQWRKWKQDEAIQCDLHELRRKRDEAIQRSINERWERRQRELESMPPELRELEEAIERLRRPTH
jgi:hypothetical protein